MIETVLFKHLAENTSLIDKIKGKIKGKIFPLIADLNSEMPAIVIEYLGDSVVDESDCSPDIRNLTTMLVVGSRTFLEAIEIGAVIMEIMPQMVAEYPDNTVHSVKVGDIERGYDSESKIYTYSINYTIFYT